MTVDDSLPPFDVLFDAAPDAILLVDADGRIQLANDRTVAFFGYAPSELEGELVELLVPTEQETAHATFRESYFEDPSRRPMGAGTSLRAERKDGSTFPVDISLSPVAIDDAQYALATVRDVSEQRGLQRKYRSLLETIPDAVVVADSDSGQIIEVNERATELFDRERSSLVGSHQTSLHPSGQQQRYRELFEHHVEADDALFSAFPNGDDILVETDDEAHVPVTINGRVTQLDDHPVLIGVFRDISERRAREQALERQLDRVETLTHVLSHDLRGPLNIAEGYREQAVRHDTPSALEKVRDAHERMEQIIDEVLTMLQDAGEPDTRPVNLRRSATECWSTVTTELETLEVRDDAVVEADPRQLRHVLENLFRNAREHGGSHVTVRVGVLDFEDGFYVEDTGPGIPESERAAVLTAGHSTRTEGTGLGLVIVREIASSHGWTVSITEGTDGGARFEFTGATVRPT